MKKQGNAWEPAQESFNNNDDTIESDLKILYNNVDLYINYQQMQHQKMLTIWKPVSWSKGCTLLSKGKKY